jgi:hypothetical protein
MARRHDRRDPSPRRRQNAHGPTPRAVAQEIDRRVLADLEDCRVAWKHNNPVALCVALMKVDIPEWLADALLTWLIATGGNATMAQAFPTTEYWRDARREQLDATRALTALAVRGIEDQPKRTEIEAFTMVAEYLADRLGDDVAPVVDADTIRKSLERVEAGLTCEGAYWKADEGLAERIRLALSRRAGRL